MFGRIIWPLLALCLAVLLIIYFSQGLQIFKQSVTKIEQDTVQMYENKIEKVIQEEEHSSQYPRLQR